MNYKDHDLETIDCDNNTDLKWCVAEENEEKGITSDAIITWLEKSTLDSSKYKLYIGSEKDIYAPSYSSTLFSGFSNVKLINFNNFDTSNVTGMTRMFYVCESLNKLYLGNFDVKAVIENEKFFSKPSSSLNVYFDDEESKNSFVAKFEIPQNIYTSVGSPATN